MKFLTDYKEMHILHLIEHLRVGGAERVVWRLVKKKQENGMKSMVCVYRDIGYFGQDLMALGIPVFFLKKDLLTSKRWIRIPVIKEIALIFESILFCARLAYRIKKYRINILHCHLFSANSWGRLTRLFMPRLKVIATEGTIAGWHRPQKHIWINRLLKGLSHQIVAVSNKVAQSVSEEQSVKLENVLVLPNGIDVPEHGFEGRKWSVHFLHKSPLRIAMIGRLEKIKRNDLFLSALHLCMEKGLSLEGWIVGDGSLKNDLVAMAQSLGISSRISFLGERMDVMTLLTSVHAVVNCSDAEGMSNAILEAMAAGCAVIATDAGGNHELVLDRKTGLLIEKGNADALSRAIQEFYQDRGLMKLLCINALKMLWDQYSMTSVIQKWTRLYEKLCSYE